VELFWILILAAAAVVIYGTIRRTSWGINLKPVACPKCGTPAPAVRSPGSVQQGLWGGHTCASCGTSFDKWGRQVERKS
jgi:hypothetical protein